MKLVMSFALLALISLAATGCSDKSTTTRSQKIEGPGGTTEIEQKDTVKQSGDNPPAP